MKKTITVLSVVLVAFAVLALTSFDSQETTATYATIAYSTAGKNIYVYYGGQSERQEIPVTKAENVNNKIIDILNDLSSKGYELVSTSSHAFNINLNKSMPVVNYEGNFIELNYTLKKK